MPRICEFYGIVIAMYFGEEHGVPHFHASYAGVWATFAIDDLRPLAGELPPRAMRMVRDWGRLRRRELLHNWERARRGQPLVRIDPLA
jgi:hypothetical protein